MVGAYNLAVQRRDYREHPIFAKNLFLEFDGERGRLGDGGKLIRSTIINQGQFATLGCSQIIRFLNPPTIYNSLTLGIGKLLISEDLFTKKP